MHYGSNLSYSFLNINLYDLTNMCRLLDGKHFKEEQHMSFSLERIDDKVEFFEGFSLEEIEKKFKSRLITTGLCYYRFTLFNITPLHMKKRADLTILLLFILRQNKKAGAFAPAFYYSALTLTGFQPSPSIQSSSM